jgi:hypothetical protein
MIVLIIVVLLVFGILNLAAPRAMFVFGLLGRRWQFADPDAVQPSVARIEVNRIFGVFMIVAAGVLLVVQIAAAHAPVDTTTGSGALAVRMDERIRAAAAATGRSPRDPRVLEDAIDAEARHNAAAMCPSPSAPPSPAPTPTGPSPSPSPQDWCLFAHRHFVTVDIKPADDYAATGRVTINRTGRPVCLTVAADVHTRGELRRDACSTSRSLSIASGRTGRAPSWSRTAHPPGTRWR